MNEFNLKNEDTRYVLSETFLSWTEKRNWLEENFGQRPNIAITEFGISQYRYTYFYFKHGIEIFFRNKSDAMLFKLTWG
jgi:hypothetical protein